MKGFLSRLTNKVVGHKIKKVAGRESSLNKGEKIMADSPSKFEMVDTHLEGVQLKRDPQVEKVDILDKTVERLYETSKICAEAKFKTDELAQKLDPGKDKIKEIAKKHKGLRGLISEKDNFGVTVTPRESTTYNREPLKRGIGISYSAVVRETIRASISVPAEVVSEEKLEEEINKALIRAGIPEDELGKVVRFKVDLDVDEKKLEEMEEQGKLDLPEQARTTQITWGVRFEKLDQAKED